MKQNSLDQNDVSLNRVHYNYRWLLGAQVTFIFLLLGLVFMGFSFFTTLEISKVYWVSVGALLIIGWLIMFFLWAPRRYRVTAYAVCPQYLFYQVGAIWYSQTSLPFNRLQHLEVVQNPFERLFKIYRLVLFTAGGAASNLAIPGLKQAQAESLRAFLIEEVKLEKLSDALVFQAGAPKE